MAFQDDRKLDNPPQSLAESSRSSKNGSARVTPCVVLSCIVAASAGFIFGYDLVIAGGIGIMDGFLEKFYPKVLEEKKVLKQDVYCKYKNDMFQLFSSSLYLGALLSSFVASFVTTKLGRKASMLVAGILFIFGTLLCSLASNISMLLSGRVIIGLGLGCSNQVVPLYISEIVPPQVRGGFMYLFGLNIGSGVIVGNIVNYFAEKVNPWGWRISFGVLGIPSFFFAILGVFLFETPLSLIQQGYHDKAQHVLIKLRGSTEIDKEYQNLVDANNIQNVEVPIKKFWAKKEYVPQFVIGMALPFFQQVVGSDALLFYGVFIFKAAGFGNEAALYSAIILGSSSLATSFIALLFVDRIGRKKLLLGASFILLLTMVIVGIIFATGLRYSTQHVVLDKKQGIELVVTLCLFVVAFGSSLGPLAWIIPSEIYSLQVRSIGLGVTVVVNMLFKFIIAQTFLSMLCALKYGSFLLFSCFTLLLMLFVAFFLPETKGLPLHSIQEIWSSHWFWKRFSGSDSLPRILTYQAQHMTQQGDDPSTSTSSLAHNSAIDGIHGLSIGNLNCAQ